MENQFVYVVIGIEEHEKGIYNKEVYGVYSTEELAMECISYITAELEFLNHCEIERVLIDEFGYK